MISGLPAQRDSAVSKTVLWRWLSAPGIEYCELSPLFRPGWRLLGDVVDVDLGFSPSTNTLPIRRLDLSVGESRELTAAWVRFPDLAVLPLRQRYTRTGERAYRYESVENSFTADLTVDDEGLVISYAELWERVAEGKTIAPAGRS